VNGKMKIVHLQVLPILSGVQKITLNIFRNLDPEKYEMYLICGNPEKGQDNALVQECETLGVKVIVIDEIRRDLGWHDLKAFFSLLKIFRKYKFDIIHTHSSKTGFLGRITGKLSGCKKVVYTVHGISFHDYQNPIKKIFFYLLEIVAGQFNDKVILVNKFYRKKFWFIPAKKLMTIYNGIEFAGLQSRNKWQDGKIRFISVGRLDAQKSPFDLLKAFYEVSKVRDNVELTLIGDGEYYSQLSKIVEQNDLGDSVKLPGWQKDIGSFLAESDIFISSPVYEAFGLVFCEAGYTGLPVISTNVEGIPEVVKDGETGILVPPRDTEAMKEAMLKLIDDESMRLEMGGKAKARVIEQFDLNSFINKYLEMYELL